VADAVGGLGARALRAAPIAVAIRKFCAIAPIPIVVRKPTVIKAPPVATAVKVEMAAITAETGILFS
jgi:hypothetical protein